MAIHARFEFVTEGVNRGGFVSNSQMIQVVEDYIYQETGKRVDIADPGFDFDSRQKVLLLKAYEWAFDHLNP